MIQLVTFFFLVAVATAQTVSLSALPTYEQHTVTRSGERPFTSTVIVTVTHTHTLRVPSTSDVWQTTLKVSTMPCTQLTTQRSYAPGLRDTVTSTVRITKTAVSVVTQTQEIYPTKTVVSVFTSFSTVTETVELWQRIDHISTAVEVTTIPILETQTLLQRFFSTITVTSTSFVTSVQPTSFFTSTQTSFFTTTTSRSGERPSAGNFNYGSYGSPQFFR